MSRHDLVAPETAPHRYVLGPEIARGGMGVVYRASDTLLGREVAVKVLLGTASARRFDHTPSASVKNSRVK